MSKNPEKEEGLEFQPAYNEKGLIPAIITDESTGEVLMMAWMNSKALDMTLTTGKVHYWSRSRNCLWLKGETSGNHQILKEIRTDCDQDALWLTVEQHGMACHTGRKSCFYRSVSKDGKRLVFAKDYV